MVKKDLKSENNLERHSEFMSTLKDRKYIYFLHPILRLMGRNVCSSGIKLLTNYQSIPHDRSFKGFPLNSVWIEGMVLTCYERKQYLLPIVVYCIRYFLLLGEQMTHISYYCIDPSHLD